MGFFSPPQIVGVAIPFLVFFSFIQGKMPRKKFKTPDVIFLFFSLLYVINFTSLLTLDYSLAKLGVIIKAINPILLYFYLRRVIRSREDLIGILYTFCYSALFPLAMLLYEMMFGSFDVTFFTPEGADRLTETRGGSIRLQGLYADLFNYTSYLIGTLLCVLFFKYDSLRNRGYKNLNKYVITIITFNLFGVFALKHAATIGVFVVLILLYLLYLSKKALLKNLLLTAFFATAGFITFSINSDITAIFAKESQVLNNQADSNIALNGRVGSWERYFNFWSDLDIFNHLFGVGFEGKKAAVLMVNAIGDFPRIFFATGIIGMIVYLMFYYLMWVKARKINGAGKFLYMGSIVIVLLFSLTLSPMLYGGVLYILAISIYTYYNSNSPKRIAFENFYYSSNKVK